MVFWHIVSISRSGSFMYYDIWGGWHGVLSLHFVSLLDEAFFFCYTEHLLLTVFGYRETTLNYMFYGQIIYLNPSY